MNDRNILLALLLIERHATFRNSYRLQKMLGYQFSVADVWDTLHEIVRRGYALDIPCANTTKDYELTEKGRLFLEAHLKGLYTELIEEYSDQLDFINNLFRNTGMND